MAATQGRIAFENGPSAADAANMGTITPAVADIPAVETVPSPVPSDRAGTLVNRRTVYDVMPKIETTEFTPLRVVRLTPLLDHGQAEQASVRVVVRKLIQDGTIMLGRMDNQVDKYKPIVYQSKVVSRKHAELVLKNGQWFIKDVGSSSGTFLNNDRLSPASTVSNLRKLNTGDVIKFGVDFRGGQEPHFRSIRVRVDLDGGAAREPHEFQKSQLQKLRNVASSSHNHDLETCALCLEDMTATSSLFVSPCFHMWHYKCIRTTVANSYPFFECPLCKRTFDLEEPSEDDEDVDEDGDVQM